MDWDVLFDGSSITPDKVISFDIRKGRGSFCKEFSLEVADYSLKDSIDLTEVPGETRIEIKTKVGASWVSEGTFFIEQCATVQTGGLITLSMWGRDGSARLTQPFARKMSKEYDEDTTLYEIVEEILTDCGVAYDAARMLIDDFTIYANSYSVQDRYPLQVLQELISVTDGFLYTDRQGQLWVVKDEYHWGDVATEINGTTIASIVEREDYPEFGNRVRVGSFADDGELDISVDLQFDEYSIAIGEGIIGRAVVTRKDGSPVPDGYAVEWDTDNSDYATWEGEETSVTTHRITDEEQNATSRRLVSTDYPIRQVHSVTEVATGETIDVKEFSGTSITLDDDLQFTNSAVEIDYSTAYATNTLTGGSTGEVEVDVHAIVEAFVRDTQTIRIDTTAGDPAGEQAANITIITKDFITDETVTSPGNVAVDGSPEGQTSEGIIDLGLLEGGLHEIEITGVTGYKDTEDDGLSNDQFRVGQVYVTSDDEETTDPNLITDHNDLSNIQGGQSGQYYHLTAAEYAALGSGGVSSLSELDDVTLSSVAEGEILAKGAGDWINQTLAEAGISAVGHAHDDRYYTETELNAGQLDTIYFQESEFLNVSAGAGDAGKPIVLDAAGHVDATMINDADVDHDATTNFVGDEHIDHSGVSVIAGTLLTGGGVITANVTLNVDEASIDHGSIAGLGDDDHTQYVLLAGRAGGQTLIGGTGSGNDLTLQSTAHATKGKIYFGATDYYDENLTALMLPSTRLGTGEGTYNFVLGSAFGSKSGFTYCNVVGSNIGNASTANVTANSITGTNIANAATGNIYYNLIAGTTIANKAASVYYNVLGGSSLLGQSTGNVAFNFIGGGNIANAATGNIYYNCIGGFMIVNAATGGLQSNLIAGGSIGNAVTNHVYYNLITGYGIANAATGSLLAVFSVGGYNLYNTTNANNFTRIIALPYESLRESSASDLTDAVAIGYRAGYQNQYNSPFLLGREAAARTNKQIVIGSSFYTGDILLARKSTIEISGAATNSISYAQRLSHITSNTAVAGFGTGIEFELEENDGTNRVAGILECLWTDAGEGANADADIVVKLMQNDGAAAEVARMVSNGDFKIQNDYYAQGNQGWSGTFTNGDGDTVTVTGGIITGVA